MMSSKGQDNAKPTSDGLGGPNVVHSKTTTAAGDIKGGYRKPGLKRPFKKNHKKTALDRESMATAKLALGRGLRKNQFTTRKDYIVDLEQPPIGHGVDDNEDLDIDVPEEKEDEIDRSTVVVATAVTEEDMMAEIRRQMIKEAVVGEAVTMPDPVLDALPPPPGKQASVETRKICGFRRKVKCFAAGLAIVVLIGIVAGVAFSFTSGSGSESDGTAPSPAYYNNHSVSEETETAMSSHLNMSGSHPSASPTPPPTISPKNSYWRGVMAPNEQVGCCFFDHFEQLGFTVTDESNIHKIMQIKVFTTDVCVTDNCSTITVPSLVVTYMLKDCSTVTRTIGAYTEEDQGFIPAGIINLMSNEYITRIDVLEEKPSLVAYFTIAYITICNSNKECFGPFGSSLDAEPTTVFENELGGVIHSLYGYSGSWLDNLGVYYQNFGDGGGMPNVTCG
jgi:Jacalin-like lectin domain